MKSNPRPRGRSLAVIANGTRSIEPVGTLLEKEVLRLKLISLLPHPTDVMHFRLNGRFLF
jgi:hypothetical protein